VKIEAPAPEFEVLSHSVASKKRPDSCYLLEFDMSNHLRILAVEDESAVAQLLSLVLGGPTSKVTHVFNGEEALAKIADDAQPFDIVITDHNMPKMTGLQLVGKLRAGRFGGKIVVLSAHLTQENVQAYTNLKVDLMLSKPFDVNDLRKRVDALLEVTAIAK
jgi:DNA-binding response OmpR family regulator